MLRCGRINAGHLPIVVAIISAATFGATYVMAVYRGDVDPLFPYISGTGADPPESCVFAMMLNVNAFITYLCVHIRHGMVRELNRGQDARMDALNACGLAAGALSALGMMVVANFQETTVHAVHIAGAFTCFGGSAVYGALQSALTCRMCPLFTSRRICYVRGGITAAGVGLFAASVTLGCLASAAFHRAHPGEPTPRPWTDPSLPGYTLHVYSAICEWLLAAASVAFLLSYSRDFETVRAAVLVQPLVAHLDHSPIGTPPRSRDAASFVTESQANLFVGGAGAGGGEV